jgi:hypothetical protein
MTTILKIEPSNRAKKRFKAILSDGKARAPGQPSEIHFGLKEGQTYLDHKDDTKRLNYHARHYANKKEKKLIDDLILSPSLLSLYLLWGMYSTLEENLEYLNKQLSKK